MNILVLTKQNGNKLAVNYNKIVLVEPIDSTGESKIWFSTYQKGSEYIIVKEDFQTILDIIKKANKSK